MNSRFLGKTAAGITPYVPGEQPQDKQYIKLNTNECPYPPAPGGSSAFADFDDLRLYPDPDVKALSREMGAFYALPENQVFSAAGSDEALAYAFMAFFSPGDKVYYPDISYGFYSVYAELMGLNGCTIPLREDFTIAPEDYFGLDGNIVIANPNAPTGIALTPAQIEQIIIANPDRLVVIDEAYADFAPGCSCIGLIEKYENLMVIQTFSKSRALAGMRIGFAFAQPPLIDGLARIKYSFNPYNLDRVAIAVGISAIRDREYLEKTVAQIIKTREFTVTELEGLGFEVLPSSANFVFARINGFTGKQLYLALKARGILVRQFEKPRISDYLRITIGTDKEMSALINAISLCLEE